MNCPTCPTLLVQLHVGPIELDECPRCLGMWFDAGELKSFLGARLEAKTLPQRFVPPTDDGTVGPRACPRCVTVKLKAAHQYGHDVSACARCDGLWAPASLVAALLTEADTPKRPGRTSQASAAESPGGSGVDAAGARSGTKSPAVAPGGSDSGAPGLPRFSADGKVFTNAGAGTLGAHSEAGSARGVRAGAWTLSQGLPRGSETRGADPSIRTTSPFAAGASPGSDDAADGASSEVTSGADERAGTETPDDTPDGLPDMADEADRAARRYLTTHVVLEGSCASCRGFMEPVTHERQNFHRCVKCDALFFPRGGLPFFARTAAATWPEPKPGGNDPVEDPRCPGCLGALHPISLSGNPVRVWACEGCWGMFASPSGVQRLVRPHPADENALQGSALTLWKILDAFTEWVVSEPRLDSSGLPRRSMRRWW